MSLRTSLNVTSPFSVFLSGFRRGGWPVILLLWSLAGSAAWAEGPSRLLTPAPGSNLTAGTITFTWQDVGSTEYFLYFGTTVGGYDLKFVNAGAATTAAVSGLPLDRRVYVRVWAKVPGGTLYYISDFSYNVDLDGDGIVNELDPDPTTAGSFVERSDANLALRLNSSGRVAELVINQATDNAIYAQGIGAYQQSLTQWLLARLEDRFDFIVYVSERGSAATVPYSGIYYSVRNDTGGIGISSFNGSGNYGSAGTLQGVIHLADFGGVAGGPSLHELLHRWGNSLLPTSVGGHWGYAGVGGQLGGWAPATLTDLGGGRYRAGSLRSGSTGWGTFANGGNGLPYAPLELYLMGMAPPSEVPVTRIPQGFAWTAESSGEFSATGFDDWSIDRVVTEKGARSPAYAASQKQFSVLFVLLTPTRLNTGRIAEFDEIVYRFGLPADDGNANLYNFWEATGGRGQLVVDRAKTAVLPQPTAPAFSVQPSAGTALVGATANFAVTATGVPAPTLLWQRKPAGAATWSDVANGPGFSGATTATLTVSSLTLAMSGDQFRCVATNASGTATSDAAALTVQSLPTITTPPSPQTIFVGGTATFSVVATGVPPPTYQWRKSTSPIGGATGSSYVLTNAQTSDAGSYDVVVTNAAGAVTSGAVTLTVNVPLPVISSATTAVATAGSTFTYTIAATNSPTSFSVTELPPGLILATSTGVISGTPTTAGSYSVTLTANNAGGVSAPVVLVLTVNPAPVAPAISVQPASATITTGMTTTLAVTATGTAPLTYQWYQGASPSTATPIAGATAATFTTPALTTATSYWVRVSNVAGRADSATATVTTVAFAPTVALTSETSNDYVTTGGTGTYRVRVTYTGQTPSAIGVTIALPTDWTLASFSGPSAAAAPAVGDSLLEWAFSTMPANELTYTFSVNYPSGQTGAKTLTGLVNYRPGNVAAPFAALTLTPISPPTITTAPVSRLAAVDTSASFSVVAAGAGPLTYQWKKDNVALVDSTRISGSATAALTVAGLVAADAGSYTVVVTNAAGSVTSSAATLTVLDVRATHSVVGAGYSAGGNVTLTQTVTYTGACTGLGWQMLLPAGWSYVSGGGTEGDVKPSAGATSLLEWAWTTIPPSPATFTVTLAVPGDQTGSKTISSLVVYRIAAGPTNVLVKPDPLTVAQVTHHSADVDRNYRLSLLELTRVIELYNTRNGTSRTGCYQVDATGEDGFNQAPTRLSSAVVTLASYHSADSDRNGKLSLLELTRVIELYNYRAGTSRTGQYHAQVGTEDGYAAGP